MQPLHPQDQVGTLEVIAEPPAAVRLEVEAAPRRDVRPRCVAGCPSDPNPAVVTSAANSAELSAYASIAPGKR